MPIGLTSPQTGAEVPPVKAIALCMTHDSADSGSGVFHKSLCAIDSKIHCQPGRGSTVIQGGSGPRGQIRPCGGGTVSTVMRHAQGVNANGEGARDDALPGGTVMRDGENDAEVL
jgi:hypothetical protein